MSCRTARAVESASSRGRRRQGRYRHARHQADRARRRAMAISAPARRSTRFAGAQGRGIRREAGPRRPPRNMSPTDISGIAAISSSAPTSCRPNSRRFEPAMLEAARGASRRREADLHFSCSTREAFGRAPKKSIDYAVIERTDKLALATGRHRLVRRRHLGGGLGIVERDEDGNSVRGHGVVLDGRTCTFDPTNT